MTEKLLKVSRIVVISAFVLVIAWDVFAQIKGGTGATVSMAIWGFASDVPFITFLAGFFCGHLFWGDPAKWKGPKSLQ